MTKVERLLMVSDKTLSENAIGRLSNNPFAIAGGIQVGRNLDVSHKLALIGGFYLCFYLLQSSVCSNPI